MFLTHCVLLAPLSKVRDLLSVVFCNLLRSKLTGKPHMSTDALTLEQYHHTICFSFKPRHKSFTYAAIFSDRIIILECTSSWQLCHHEQWRQKSQRILRFQLMDRFGWVRIWLCPLGKWENVNISPGWNVETWQTGKKNDKKGAFMLEILNILYT